jgi:hypothetical protein
VPDANIIRLRANTTEAGYQVGSIWDDFDEETTPELRWPDSSKTYKQMRTDPQVAAVTKAVMFPIIRTQFRVERAKAKASITQAIADDLGLPVAGKEQKPGSRLSRFSFVEHVRHALLSLVYGHAFFEQVYEYSPKDGIDRLHKLAYRPPLTLEEINVARDGGLTSIKQRAAGAGNVVERPIPVRNLVAYVNDREGGNWKGVSMLRPAFAPWWLKVQAMRVQSVGFERNGIGVPLYKASPVPESLQGAEAEAYKEKEIARGRSLAQALRGGENAGMAIPSDADLSLLAVTGRLPDVLGGLRWFDEQIARATLANFLSLGTETGSWALGETFETFFVMSLQTLAKQIADVVTQHVIEDWVDINFGPDEPAPRVVFDEIGSKQSITAEAIMALVQCGALVMDDNLERYVRETFNLPEIDKATRRPPKEGVQQPAGGTQQQSGSGEPNSNENDNPAAPEGGKAQ